MTKVPRRGPPLRGNHRVRFWSANSNLVVDGRRLGPRGWDRIELLLRANGGEEPKPLARIASGGELSRIMRALKLCLRRADCSHLCR